MGVPRRFVTEYPARCLAILDMAQPLAQRNDLLASFALMAAASVLVIPYERLKAKHPLTQERGSELYEALHGLERRPWSTAPFWVGREPAEWHFSRIMGDPNNVARWTNAAGQPSMSTDANEISGRKAGDVLRVLRNALAHGNVVYLNKHGQETPDTAVHTLAFLSRYEELGGDHETYRLAAAPAEQFLEFLRRWAAWLASFPVDDRLIEAA